jgi:NADH:ubiquinone oxidoreductase subunit F (NADH-binding)/(2Fe-2S) ferredoxin
MGEVSEMNRHRATLMICGGTGCIACGGIVIKDALQEELDRKGLAHEFNVVLTGCNGFCAAGPILTVLPDGIFYEKLKAEDMPLLVEEHFLKGRPVDKLMYKEPEKKHAVPAMKDIAFFNLQVLRVLRNKGLIDPEKIDEYIARDGYQAAAKSLTEMTGEQIIDTIRDSGLRGRGGAGFPTGRKLDSCRKTDAERKFIICNGDEGDPGAFMDRSIMESDPHVILEGMIIAGKAIGATKGYIYVRAEYPLAVRRLEIAIEQAKEYGLLGRDILGTGTDLDIEIYQGAGAFVCGESTALMRSIEGKRGMPRPTPPNSVYSGLWGMPSVLNNVETLANIPQIILNGPEWFKGLGTDKSTGTKVFALTGSVKNIGLIEVPMGMPLRSIIYDIGGGIEDGRKFKAVQLGGPSGGCVPEQLLDTPVTYEDIVKTGAIVGSGGMIVLDDTSCMVSVAKFFLEFTQEESCGKCVPCRIGTKRLLEVLERITEGEGRQGDIELMEKLSNMVVDASLCGLGKSAPNPILSTIKYFRDEYEAHLEGRCPAAKCKALLTYTIIEDACNGCGACRRACAAGAIEGEKKKPHTLDQSLCVKCGACFDVCKFKAVHKE